MFYGATCWRDEIAENIGESPHVVSFGKAEEAEGLPVAVCFSGVNALCKASSIKLLHLKAARRFRLKG